MNAESICKKENCTGCCACMNACMRGAITLQRDETGFVWPVVDSALCCECGRCARTCANARNSQMNKKPAVAYAAWSRDNGIRRSSSSGGVFKVLASSVISRGGVVNAVRFDADMYLRHEILETREALLSLTGSKYVQSDVGYVYARMREALEGGREALFVGTPCQVSGFIAFLGKAYPNLTTCDFICHGVPSPETFRAHLKNLELLGRIRDYLFRDLRKWGFESIACAMDGSEARVENDQYMAAFLRSEKYRKSCYSCRYATVTRVADITLGDFWGVEKFNVTRKRYQNGCSLVLLNSAKGRKLFESVREELVLERYPLEACRDNRQLFAASKEASDEAVSTQRCILVRLCFRIWRIAYVRLWRMLRRR